MNLVGLARPDLRAAILWRARTRQRQVQHGTTATKAPGIALDSTTHAITRSLCYHSGDTPDAPLKITKRYRLRPLPGFKQALTTWCAISVEACWPGGLAGVGYRSAARSETSPAIARKVSSKSSRRPR